MTEIIARLYDNELARGFPKGCKKPVIDSHSDSEPGKMYASKFSGSKLKEIGCIETSDKKLHSLLDEIQNISNSDLSELSNFTTGSVFSR